mmetsp:Transcript_17906/g.26498  ORF Transcript_17906/g.26498 Transcript_17906/m.26498 type:complete len:133 (-) Transcript_17906:434-832(-)
MAIIRLLVFLCCMLVATASSSLCSVCGDHARNQCTIFDFPSQLFCDIIEDTDKVGQIPLDYNCNALPYSFYEPLKNENFHSNPAAPTRGILLLFALYLLTERKLAEIQMLHLMFLMFFPKWNICVKRLRHYI